jgi:Fe-S-cluster containining protein
MVKTMETPNHKQEPQHRTQCKACGTCCYDHTVLVSFRDLREIHKYYPDRPLENLVVLYDAATEYADRAILERFHPAVLAFVLPGDKHAGECGKSCACHRSDAGSTWKAYLGLRFKKLPNGKTVCPQLDRDAGRCTIHAHKPLVCRTYPHVLDDAGKLARLEKVRCAEPWGDPANLTPEERERIQNTVVWAYRAHDHFIEEVKEWNVDPRDKTVGDFFTFVLRAHPGDDKGN